MLAPNEPPGGFSTPNTYVYPGLMLHVLENNWKSLIKDSFFSQLKLNFNRQL